MKLPIDLDTAKKLKDKGYMNDSQYAKVEALHERIKSVGKKLADGTPDEPIQEPEPSWQDRLKASLQASGQIPAGAPPMAQPQTAPVEQQMPSQNVQPPPIAQGQLVGENLGSVPAPSMPQIQQFDPNMNAGPYGLINQGLTNQDAAAQRKGAEEYNVYKGHEEEAQKAAIAEQARMADENKHLEEKNGQIQKMVEDYQTQKIDPDRFWANKSTGEKVLAGIGMFLGAFGTRGNQAVDVINQAIDRDIEAQKHDAAIKGSAINQQQNLFSNALQITKNADAASLVAKNAALEDTKMKILATDARYSSQEAHGKAQVMLGQIGLQQQQNQIAINQMLMKQYAAQNPEGAKEWLEPEQRERIVPGFKGFAVSKKDAEDLRGQAGDYQSVNKAIGELKTLARQGFITDPSDRARAQTLASYVAAKARNPIYGGRVMDSELKTLEEMIPDPSSFTSLASKTLASLDKVSSLMGENINDKARATGLVPYKDAMGIKTSTEAPAPYGSKSPIKQTKMGK